MFAQLSSDDQRVLRELLLAVAKGPFFPDWEFYALFGCDRTEVLEIAARPDTGPMTQQVIGNALNNMLGYPHGQDAAWSDWLSVSRDKLEELELRWRALQSPLRCSAVRVHGPAQIAGDFFRVIKFTTERGGHGMTCQVWKQGHWTIYEDGPGGDQILQAHRADAQLLAESGVDDGPLPEDSDPNAVM